MDKGNCWNSENTCTYKQTILVNPLIGGFSPYADTEEESNFVSYQFTGEYKLSAQNSKVIIYTTDNCSNMSVSFDYAAVVYQQKVTPQKRKTECRQVVDFDEQRYVAQINPFTRQTIEPGLMIIASGNNLVFKQLDLVSLTNTTIIAKQLWEEIQPFVPKLTEGSEGEDTTTTRDTVGPAPAGLTYQLEVATPSSTTQSFKLSNAYIPPGTGATFKNWFATDLNSAMTYTSTNSSWTYNAKYYSNKTNNLRLGFTMTVQGPYGPLYPKFYWTYIAGKTAPGTSTVKKST